MTEQGERTNEWGVSFSSTEDFSQWDWGYDEPYKTIYESVCLHVAQTVMMGIELQTMAAVKWDMAGNQVRVILGLFECETNLSVSLSELIDDWIYGRVNHRDGTTSVEYAEEARAMADELSGLAAKLRAIPVEPA